MRRLAVLIAALLLLAACGDDSGTTTAGGVSDEFCAALEPLAEIDPDGLPTEEQLEQTRAARDAAPESTQAAFDSLISLGEALSQPEIELDDLAVFDETQLAEASQALMQAADDCGVEVPLFEDTAGTEGSNSSPSDDYDSTAMRARMEGENPGVEVRNIGRFNDQISVQVGDVDEASALAVCASAASYLESIGFAAEVRITDTSDMAFAHLPRGGECAPGDV